MDDDLLMGGDMPTATAVAAPAPAVADDELGDAFDDFLAEEAAAATTEGAAEAADASAAEKEVPTLADGRPVTALTKKQAKAELEKKEYKSWKKAMKSIGALVDSDDEGAADAAAEEKKEKKEKKDKKDKSDKKEKKEKKKKGDKRGRGSEDDEGDFNPNELEGFIGDAEELDKAKRRRREKATSRIAKMDAEQDYDGSGARGGRAPRATGAVNPNVAKKLSKDERARLAAADAEALVQKMRAARKHDYDIIMKRSANGASSSSSVAGAPIARLQMKQEVLNFGRRVDNEPALVGAGFLGELAYWILDASGELAPLDLRNVAYELLLSYGFKGSMDVTHPGRVVDHEDLNAYSGIGREELETTTIGKAVNTSRQHAAETAQNRQRAVTLLQRLSKAFANSGDADDEADRRQSKSRKNDSGPLAVRWPCEKDSSILTPYEYISNATEVFQAKMVQVDPLDPESYLRVPPLRIRKTPIR